MDNNYYPWEKTHFRYFTPHISKVSVNHTLQANVHFRPKLLDMTECETLRSYVDYIVVPELRL